jgi:ADP-ribose pyrophosphatase YjhB (NUDIX family)
MADEGDQAARWVVHGERTVYDNPWVRLAQVDVRLPGGRRFWHHVVHLQTVAVAAVLDERGRVLMLRRHRFVPDTYGWELPGGFPNDGEDLASAAAREVEEETGWRPTGPGVHLLTFHPIPGMVDARHAIYVFSGAEYVGEPADVEEAGQTAWLPLQDMPSLIEQGEVLGSGSLVGLLYLLARRGTEG